MRRWCPAVAVTIALAGCSDGTQASRTPPPTAPVVVGRDPGRLPLGAPCPVTRERDRPAAPPPEVTRWGGGGPLFGGGGLWVVLPVPDYRASAWPDGGYGLKTGWWRAFDGDLTLHARALHTGATATWRSAGGYGPRGFQPTSIRLPETGCWLITGTLGNTRVHFVANIHA